VVYGEGVFVGYRHYDSRDVAPRFPFGHGLGYTTFDYRGVEVESGSGSVRVRVALGNTGGRAGREVVQCYVRALDPVVPRPDRELAGFAKLEVGAGEEASAVIELNDAAFSRWDETTHSWVVDPGPYELLIGSSSRDIRLRAEVRRG
jgi:beta-glucosidase